MMETKKVTLTWQRDLSLEKYCSVVHSLAPDFAITYALTLA